MNNTAIDHLPVAEAPRYRFRPTDRIDIDGSNYAPVSSDQFGYVFRRVGDDSGLGPLTGLDSTAVAIGNEPPRPL